MSSSDGFMIYSLDLIFVSVTEKYINDDREHINNYHIVIDFIMYDYFTLMSSKVIVKTLTGPMLLKFKCSFMMGSMSLF